MNSFQTAKRIFEILSTQKCDDLILINISKVSGIADYCIICSATSTTSVRALSNYLEDKGQELGVVRTDGVKEGQWAVLDFGDVIVQIFLNETRAFYNLEKFYNAEKNLVEIK